MSVMTPFTSFVASVVEVRTMSHIFYNRVLNRGFKKEICNQDPVMGKNKAACISVYQTQYVDIFFNPPMRKKSNSAKKLLLTAAANVQ